MFWAVVIEYFGHFVNIIACIFIQAAVLSQGDTLLWNYRHMYDPSLIKIYFVVHNYIWSTYIIHYWAKITTIIPFDFCINIARVIKISQTNKPIAMSILQKL